MNNNVTSGNDLACDLDAAFGFSTQLFQIRVPCLEDGSLGLREIGALFTLSPATFTRFAGTRWQTSGEKVPDLWRNTAQVIRNNSDFRGTPWA